MANYTVNPETLQLVGDEGSKVAQAVTAALDSMNADVQAKMQGRWSGEARSLYDTAFAECKKQAGMIPDVVNRTVATITNAHGTYVNAEKVNASIFGG